MTGDPNTDDPEGVDQEPTDRQQSAAEVDAQFAAIVSGISSQMSWGTTAQELDTSATAGAPPATGPVRHGPDPTAAVPGTAGSETAGSETALERQRRRNLRRAERAEEVEIFEAGRADSEAELRADEAHFVPPDPPPLPRPGRRTVVALLLLVIGLVLMVRPGLLQVSPEAVLILGIGCLLGGFGLLVHGLRPRASDPDDAQGWDDGARL